MQHVHCRVAVTGAGTCQARLAGHVLAHSAKMPRLILSSSRGGEPEVVFLQGYMKDTLAVAI